MPSAGFGVPQPVQNLALAAFRVPQGPVQPPAAGGAMHHGSAAAIALPWTAGCTIPAGCTGTPIGAYFKQIAKLSCFASNLITSILQFFDGLVLGRIQDRVSTIFFKSFRSQ